ncbi:hypothetical protein EDB80DRAFT_636538 [Ilyonectria destructans]|nr:hypothetical protein EDB80DRAFT_636538 [Ilyonectria destructans]
MKGQDQVIEEFNTHVNMTSSELEKWLKSNDSSSAGWPKEEEDGETVGHDSGRKIVEILKANPNKDATNYNEEQIAHMRKVVGYCKRHLAQEAAGTNEKSTEDVKKTKSYASLKNWGHDVLKAHDKAEKGDDKDDDDTEDGTQAGDKRKASRGQRGSTKKRETRKGKGATTGEEEGQKGGHGDSDGDEDVEQQDQSKTKQERNQTRTNSRDKTGSKATKGPEKGETVSWNWGSGQPEGEVLDVKGEDTSITTKKGNQVSRKGTKEDPAVILDTGKSKAIKLNHELN